jgi:hypothetical protein
LSGKKKDKQTNLHSWLIPKTFVWQKRKRTSLFRQIIGDKEVSFKNTDNSHTSSSTSANEELGKQSPVQVKKFIKKWTG